MSFRGEPTTPRLKTLKPRLTQRQLRGVTPDVGNFDCTGYYAT